MATTQIVNRQIADGAIDNAKVASGAAIASSKLADGANFLKKDGSVTMTGNLAMGTNKITGLGTPSTSTDAATMGYVDAQIASVTSFFQAKGAVRAASTANVSLSAPGATIDGVSMVSGDRVLLKNQTAGAENGIYIWNGASSTATRATDMDAWAEVPGALVVVEEGTANADTIWLSTANLGGTLGSTAITFQALPMTAGLSTTNFVDNETPTGSVNGSNTNFTLANVPTSGSEKVFLNGMLQDSGGANDYTISTNTITFVTAPIAGDKIRVCYRK